TVFMESNPLLFQADVNAGVFQLAIFSEQQNYTPDYLMALNALNYLVLHGGKAIVNSFATQDDLSPFGALFTGDTNGPAVNLTAYSTGITNPLALTNQSYSFY